MKLIHHKFSTFTFTCLTLTALTFANGGTDKIVALVSTKDSAGIGLTRKNNGVQFSRVLPSPGVGRADLSALGLSGEGLPNLTVESIRSLKVGDPMSIATPDGGSMDFIVERRAWTGIDEKQIYLKQGETGNSLYGIISQIGPRLTGYFLARNGSAYALTLADAGRYKLTLRPNYGALECGVGRVLPEHPVLGSALKGTGQPQNEGGIAATLSPCPPEVSPIGLPPGLVKESGIIIDVLLVFSVDANEALVAAGTTPYDQAVLTVAQANLAMKNSTEQAATDFDGQDATNRLNTDCGYGIYPEPQTVENLVQAWMTASPPNLNQIPPPLDLAPRSCTASDTDVAFHEARPGVTPAETEVCMPRLRLVGALVADGFFGQEEPFISTGFAVDLSRLSTPGDGYLDYVLDWRDALGADEVALVGTGYGSDSGFVGLASVMSDANTPAQGQARLSIPANPHPVVDSTKVNAINGILGPSDVSTLQAFSESPFCLLDITVLGDTVYAHELGHNLGCLHDHDNAGPPAGALFPDSFGFGDEDFRTVMAYPNGTNVRLPGYSNPTKAWRDYGAGQTEESEAGIEFDFQCQALDTTDGSDAEYIEGSGFQLVFTGPGAPPPVAEPCTEPTDDAPNSSVAMNVASDSRIEDSAIDTANNARSISQVKFDFAKFRCSLFPVVDCNDNEIDDYIEAVDAVSDDCNSDGIPDDCQVAVEDPGIPSPIDCNQNEIPDTCDITNGDSQDVNVNGVPDECEDQTLLFRESFENFAFGVNDGPLEIAKVGTVALAELRKLDPTFPQFFATIETDDQNPNTEAGGFIYTDNIPSLFMYGLGQNGTVLEWGGIFSQGFAKAFGSKGYGQRLIFNSITGDFPSADAVTHESGVTTIKMRRNAKESRFYMNAADFTGYFDTEALYPGTFPQLINFQFLQANVVTVQAFLGDEMKFTQAYDLRSIQTPTFPTGFPTTVIAGGPVRIAQPFGQETDPEFVFDRIVISGAFVVIDNLSFDLGQVFPNCPGDVAGGIPEGGLPTSDGRVGADDLILVLALFGQTSVGNPLAAIADVNDDEFVDALDLLEILSVWGNCPGGAG